MNVQAQINVVYMTVKVTSVPLLYLKLEVSKTILLFHIISCDLEQISHDYERLSAVYVLCRDHDIFYIRARLCRVSCISLEKRALP